MYRIKAFIKSFVWISIGIWLALLFGAGNALAQKEGIYRLLESDEHKVLVVAHCADPINFPENSLEGLLHCINNGIDIAEVDVQRTKDGQLILMHDVTLNRTTTGKGRISQFDWKHIQSLQLRDRFKKPTAYKVPLLRDALKLAKGRIVLNIDKAGSNMMQIMKLVKELDCGPYVIMKGVVDIVGYEKMKQKSDADPLFMPIVTMKMSAIDSFTKVAKPLAVEILVGSDTTYLTSESGLQMFRANGCNIWFNALFDQIAAGKAEKKNKMASWDYFIGLGARFIQTDYPLELMNHLVSKGLRLRSSSTSGIAQRTLQEAIDSVSNRLMNSSDIVKTTKFKHHVIRKGDTLYGIAQRYRIALVDLLKHNPMHKNNSRLIPGKVVKVPIN